MSNMLKWADLPQSMRVGQRQSPCSGARLIKEARHYRQPSRHRPQLYQVSTLVRSNDNLRAKAENNTASPF